MCSMTHSSGLRRRLAKRGCPARIKELSVKVAGRSRRSLYSLEFILHDIILLISQEKLTIILRRRVLSQTRSRISHLKQLYNVEPYYKCNVCPYQIQNISIWADLLIIHLVNCVCLLQ